MRTSAKGRIHLSSIAALAPLLVGLEHVLDVQVAEQLAVVADHREAAEPGGGAQRLDVRRVEPRGSTVSVSDGISICNCNQEQGHNMMYC